MSKDYRIKFRLPSRATWDKRISLIISNIFHETFRLNDLPERSAGETTAKLVFRLDENGVLNRQTHSETWKIILEFHFYAGSEHSMSRRLKKLQTELV